MALVILPMLGARLGGKWAMSTITPARQCPQVLSQALSLNKRVKAACLTSCAVMRGGAVTLRDLRARAKDLAFTALLKKP